MENEEKIFLDNISSRENEKKIFPGNFSIVNELKIFLGHLWEENWEINFFPGHFSGKNKKKKMFLRGNEKKIFLSIFREDIMHSQFSPPNFHIHDVIVDYSIIVWKLTTRKAFDLETIFSICSPQTRTICVSRNTKPRIKLIKSKQFIAQGPHKTP